MVEREGQFNFHLKKAVGWQLIFLIRNLLIQNLFAIGKLQTPNR